LAWQVVAGPADAGKRLDAFLAGALPPFSRTRIKDLIQNGMVSVNDMPCGEPKRHIRNGDSVLLLAPAPVEAEPQPQDIPIDILYEDEHLIVVDKPAGMVVHPAPGSPDGTLVNALIFHCGDSLAGIGGVRRPGIVHRLDKETSGVMVAAKTESALNRLAGQFADHGRTGPLRRIYTGFVWGRVQAHSGSVEAPLGRDANNRLKQAVRKDGRKAVTHYQTVARYGGTGWDITDIDCRLETGRTHQIRVHMTHIGHPLVADPLYGAGFATKANKLPEDLRACVNSLKRQTLHARLLGFRHPATGADMVFESALPPDLAALRTALAPYDSAAGWSGGAG